MPSDEIVNPLISPVNRRWQILQVLAPIAGVLLVIGAIALVSWHSYKATRAGAISLTNDLLRSQQRYITQEVSNYLSPAISSTVLAHDMLNLASPAANANIFLLLSRSILRNVPQVDGFYLANQNGEFWRVSREGQNFQETILGVDAKGQPDFQHLLVNLDGEVLQQGATPAHDFNPTTLPWYQGALHKANRKGIDRIFWSDPYPYPQTHQFIVTASIAIRTLNGREVVFAINISLNQLTNFLNSLKVGKSGQAVIVSLSGQVIAGHNMADLGKPGFQAANVYLNPVTQPVFTRALNMFRILGPGAGIIRARGKDYVTMASAMPLAKHSWVLILNAPENDFASFAQVIQKQTVYFSLLIVGLACLLACGLIFQGRRVNFLKRVIETNKENNLIDNALLLKVANTPGLLDPHREVPILTEVLTERAAAQRAGIWRLLPDGNRLLCEDVFDRPKDVHGSGMELTRAACPALFDNLTTPHLVNIPDAATDPQYQAFQRLVMRPAGTTHLVYLPVQDLHQPLGVIMIEDPQQLDGLDRVLALVAAVVAVRFAQLQKTAVQLDSVGAGDLEKTLAKAPKPGPLHMVEGFLIPPGEGSGGLPASGLYPQVPVMVLEFAEAFTEQKEGAEQTLQLIGQLSDTIQQLARQYGVFSLQVTGNRLILLGGCSQTPEPATLLRLAEAAIAIREASLTALLSQNSQVMIRIGIDIGPILAARLGKDPSIFNVWGTGLGVAELLARTAPDGGQIQVSDQAYQIMRNYFLFRPRGEFYLPGEGITQTYILAGRR
ncbi:adenylate/guanylate cyclase domain-containing protein [Oecophyllibacter saccharovorans]|uniref:adenylate/guanylate cyclase domain-containing protein n=1 Tax=Oecophyllibacter saccharovorans TaxID=2558360 RepID=UPI00117085A2|nr:adenylate/guanylate cyclase domain-containing protein [Oecophyllibacter saccharovorans]TPW34738.1 GAF domain-containing protein [Oecophyllibacter saccharovorans]